MTYNQISSSNCGHKSRTTGIFKMLFLYGIFDKRIVPLLPAFVLKKCLVQGNAMSLGSKQIARKWEYNMKSYSSSAPCNICNIPFMQNCRKCELYKQFYEISIIIIVMNSFLPYSITFSMAKHSCKLCLLFPS